MNRVIGFLTNGTPWAIEQSALESIINIAQRENNLEAVLHERGEPLDNTYKVEVRDGIAIIPITGPLFPRANLFSEISGAYSVEMLALDLAQAESNADVRGVVLKIDSPGGHTTMINEFANQIAAFNKPIVSYVVGQAASAAYWIASASDKIIIDNTAMLGSIGVVAGFAAKDSKTIEIVSSYAEDKRPDVTTEAGKSVIQAIVDDMETVFIESVMNFRGLTHEQVTALRGGVVVGSRAVRLGFADEIGNLESTIFNLSMENPMDLLQLKAEHKDVYQAAFDEGKDSVNAETLLAEGATTEHDRISAILNHEEAEGREAQAKAFALDTDMTADAAAKVLAVSPKVTETPAGCGNQFQQHMDALGNPAIGADDDANNDTGADNGAAGWNKAFSGLTVMKGGRR